MDKTLTQVCASLDDLADSILKAYPDERTMVELWGWNCPPLNRHDLAILSKNIADRLRKVNVESLEVSIKQSLQRIPERIVLFKAHTINYLFNGNGAHAAAVYMSLIEWITLTLEPLFGWEVLQDNKVLPKQLVSKLRSIQSELNEIMPEKKILEDRIRLINEATETAESLPTDLENLKEARNRVSKFSTDAAELYGKIDIYFKDSDKTSKIITEKKIEADKLVAQCEEAYRITTTKGLAAAFDQRANRLSMTMWIWVGGLLLSLVTSGLIGASRIETLMKFLEGTNPQWGVIWMNFSLSVIGLAAPIWFAWIATKQIGQRFKLAEDYAFKASVAKAYEGYKKEAARLDEALEVRLFSSALTRLEEAPLRLVNEDTHGSPWHELLNTRAFQKAMDAVPELKEEVMSITKKDMNNLIKKN